MGQRLHDARQALARGDREAALRALVPALEEAPEPQTLGLLAQVALGLGQAQLARSALNRALGANPANPHLHAFAAAAAQMLGESGAAETHARRALSMDASHPIAAALLIELLGDRLQIGAALSLAERVLARHPGAWQVRAAQAAPLLFCGEAAAAGEQSLAALKAAPHALSARQNACLAALYDDSLPPQGVAARHRQLGAGFPKLPEAVLASRPPRAGRPLRLGLLSADLRNHPMGWFTAPLLRELPRARVQPFVYHDGEPDALTAQLAARVPDWRATRGRSDAEVFDAMQADGIDVLLDLGGYTHGARPRLLASRAAPAQLAWLGYPFSTGLAAMDGLVGDDATLPSTAASMCHEHLYRLRGGLFCFEPIAGTPKVGARSDGPVRFGSFNHLAKLSPATVSLWVQVLQAVPDSTLRLCAMGLADGGVRERIAGRFAAAGLDPARLELRPPVPSPPELLARYAEIDIALDPLPFNGGTTTCQALWQGVPVVTLPGALMPARLSLSILDAVGLPECVAADRAGYVAIAARLAADAGHRRALREQLRERMRASPLMDPVRFAEAFAAVVEQAAG
ncbi:MAG TPA: hypothetical protein VFG21_11755 [Xanthomonadaceae bacterium]|nr:hypothetical protein [Xanthomonadaceae bacterium]